MRPESTIEKIKWYDKKASECAKKYKQEFWLAKIEHTYLYGQGKKLRKMIWVVATWVGAGDEEIDVIHTTT